jgi:hypothetical protein
MVSDGSGGMIVTWLDSRFGIDGGAIFAQRIDSAGLRVWTADGVQLSPATVHTRQPSISSDGNGGAVIVWNSGGSFSNVFAQRISAVGTTQWTAGGVPICSGTAYDGVQPDIVGDAAGGAFIAWTDFRHGDGQNSDLYAQRVNGAGAVQWVSQGVAVVDSTGFQGDLHMESDGAGGAVVAWRDTRASFGAIYVQRMNAGGMQWGAGGVQVNSGVGGSLYPRVIGDAGGALVCWVDRRLGTPEWDIYVQKVSAGGGVLWTLDGVAACLTAGLQSDPRITSDGNGGAILTWYAPTSASNPTPDIYAQRVNSAGAAQWGASGAAVCLAASGQFLPDITSDGSGGAVLTWFDARNAGVNDIYAQRINSSGAQQWTTDGVAVSTATFVQHDPIIMNDGSNGVIVTWMDFRNDLGANRNDIFCQRVGMNGVLGGASSVGIEGQVLGSVVALEQNRPNPFVSQTTIGYHLASETNVTLKVYDVSGREVATLVDGVQAPGSKSVRLDAGALTSGVYFYRLQAGRFVETKELVVLR